MVHPQLVRHVRIQRRKDRTGFGRIEETEPGPHDGVVARGAEAGDEADQQPDGTFDAVGTGDRLRNVRRSGGVGRLGKSVHTKEDSFRKTGNKNPPFPEGGGGRIRKRRPTIPTPEGGRNRTKRTRVGFAWKKRYDLARIRFFGTLSTFRGGPSATAGCSVQSSTSTRRTPAIGNASRMPSTPPSVAPATVITRT